MEVRTDKHRSKFDAHGHLPTGQHQRDFQGINFFRDEEDFVEEPVSDRFGGGCVVDGTGSEVAWFCFCFVVESTGSEIHEVSKGAGLGMLASLLLRVPYPIRCAESVRRSAVSRQSSSKESRLFFDDRPDFFACGIFARFPSRVGKARHCE